MINKEHIIQEIEYLNHCLKETEDTISNYKKKMIILKRQRSSLHKKLLEAQQLYWEYGGKDE